MDRSEYTKIIRNLTDYRTMMKGTSLEVAEESLASGGILHDHRTGILENTDARYGVPNAETGNELMQLIKKECEDEPPTINQVLYYTALVCLVFDINDEVSRRLKKR